MIDIDFSPNSIISSLKLNEEILDCADSLERMSLPENDDISRELDKVKKEIDSYASSITTQSKDLLSELSSILNKDFEYKLNLYIQLLKTGLTEEEFPIQEWISEKEKLEESFSVNDFNGFLKEIKQSTNKDNQENLITQYFNIIKSYLNSNLSFKDNNGFTFFNEINKLGQDLLISNDDLFEKLKSCNYIKEKGYFKECSQTNFWNIYVLLKKPEENYQDITKYLLQINKDKIKDFVSFLEKTDFFLVRDYKNKITGFKQNNLREMLSFADNKELRDVFFPEYMTHLEKAKNRLFSNKDKESFECVLIELEKGIYCLNLLNKFDKKFTTTKSNKI